MNLPNKISMIRIIFIPIFVTVFLLDKYIPYAQLIGTVIFTLAMATDALDGYIARKRNIVTNLGKFLDSIADKALVSAALFMLVYAGIGFPVWTAVCSVVIITRELVISFLRQMAAANSVILAADKLGKIKAVFQDVSLVVLLMCNDLKKLFSLTTDIIMYIGFALFVLSTLLTIVSGVNYLIKNKSLLR